ncbi:quinon protein alcohol dehydrogenase-like superfamily [Xylaria telfairii]|nr:quinon protein alcohol dehydrogenase-like superfamily [Xylaria telfairii]
MDWNSTARPHGAARFDGQGIQNTGSIHVGRDVNIIAGTKGTDALLKLRLTDPRDDKTRIEQQKGGLLYDSYKWILNHEDFQRWRDGEGNQLLWIRGDPGKGKTMLLCGVIDELKKADRSDWNVVYYFCQATNDQLHKATSVLRGLIFSLLSQQRDLLESVREEIDQASGELFQDINGWTALCRIFGRLMDEVGKLQQTTYLIVDALDECLEDQHHLLKWIEDFSSSRIKMLVSSRNWPSIESGLSSATQKVQLRLELNHDSISNAVDSYIDYKVAELAKTKKLNTEAQKAVQQHLKSNSSNTFLWVALVCQKLGHKDTYPRKVLKVLHTFPVGLNELYKRMADQLLALEDVEDVELCCQVLAIQVLAYRPLSLTELSFLVDSLEGSSSECLQDVIELCGSFLTVKDETIYFVHQSAKDYLVEHMSDSIFCQRLLTGHHDIFVQSVQALSKTLQENVYQLPSLGSLIESIDVPNPDPLNGIRYACVYWADHFENAKPIGIKSQDLEDGGLVHTFLETHLLHWLEALSLLKSSGTGIGALTKLLSFLQENKQGDKDLGKLVYDAMRFSRYHKPAIEAAPLQVYGSGLAFSPTRSVVRKLFLNKKPEWLLMRPARENNWSSNLQTLEGHGSVVISMAFSSNGKHLVSGSQDCTARIWDVTTGGCLNILEGHHREVHSVAFSPNDKFIASSSWDFTIRIWDAETGVCLQTLDSTRACPIGDHITGGTVVFPDDESVRFVSVNLNDGVHTWNIATGESLQTVQITASVGMCAGISRNGTRVLQEKGHEGRVVVVDIVAGQFCETLWHKHLIFELPSHMYVALSPGGGCVAAMVRCYEHDSECDRFCCKIQVWSLATDKCIRTVHFPGRAPLLALSPNNRFLAAASYAMIVEWDISTGQQILIAGELATGTRQVLEFSPDSKLLVSDGLDGGIWVWDLTASRQHHRTSGEIQYNDNQVLQDIPETPSIDSMILSSNGKLLGFVYKTHVQVWDTTKNECLSTIMGDWDTLKFSPDSKHIALLGHSITTESYKTISLFDAITGRSLWVWPIGYFDHRSAQDIILSADGRRLASIFPHQFYEGEYCDTVQILDAATGMCVSKFSGSNPYESSLMALSSDGTKIATMLRQKFVQIWDIATGSRIHSIITPSSLPADNNPLPLVATFSPDDRHIAFIINNFDMICIYDVATGTELKILDNFLIDRPRNSGTLRWEQAGLQTCRGIYSTHSLLNDTRNRIQYGLDDIPVGTLSGIGISLDKRWILKNGECYLWIPLEMREVLHTLRFAQSGNTIAFGDTADQIYCIRLPEDKSEA